MDSKKRQARVAGLTYLLLFTAPFSLIYVPNKLMVRGDAAATANNVLAHETMFRLSIVNELFTAVTHFFLCFRLSRRPYVATLRHPLTILSTTEIGSASRRDS